jgi:hypothetical protein
MGCVHFVDGFAYASNGGMLVKQTLSYHSIIDPENLNGTSLHRDNYANIMQFEIARATPDGVHCSNKDGRTAFFEYYDRKGQEIPDFESVLGKLPVKAVDFIGIRPKDFDLLSKVLYNGEGVRVRFAGIDKAMVCDVIAWEEQVAIVMPLILNGTLF